jgi:hypothetical protein
MHRDFPQFRTLDFLMRTADQVDAQMHDLDRRFEGTMDAGASFLPRDLKEHARPGTTSWAHKSFLNRPSHFLGSSG